MYDDCAAPAVAIRIETDAPFNGSLNPVGDDLPFNSLDAQRESAEAYISSQQHRGWTALERLYEDGGYTGANLERPALRAHVAPTRGQRQKGSKMMACRQRQFVTRCH